MWSLFVGGDSKPPPLHLPVTCRLLAGPTYGIQGCHEFISYCWLFNIVYIHSFDCSLQMSPSKKFYYEIFLILFCVLPVTSSLFVSIYLFNLTRQKRNAESGGDTSAFKNKVKSLVFIFATTVWTSCSLLPYRIMNLARIHLFTWSELSCEGKQMMNWVAWILIYLLTINPIVNPLITSLIYAPYRTTIKKFLVNIPVGNRPFYSYQGEHLHQDCSDESENAETLAVNNYQYQSWPQLKQINKNHNSCE
ncbi:hypothetical protein RB195_023466 [Necator americanus]|uniref:G-protein coupled receptors family 1 profile domain-containing protein n=1 Tax=Necator americanus TaxID=51031 RepID=A0ABR1EJB3_NECAM